MSGSGKAAPAPACRRAAAQAEASLRRGSELPCAIRTLWRDPHIEAVWSGVATSGPMAFMGTGLFDPAARDGGAVPDATEPVVGRSGSASGRDLTIWAGFVAPHRSSQTECREAATTDAGWPGLIRRAAFGDSPRAPAVTAPQAEEAALAENDGSKKMQLCYSVREVRVLKCDDRTQDWGARRRAVTASRVPD